MVHENRGLLEHIKDVVRRVATAGFTGLSIDLLSRDGGAVKLSDQAAYGAALAKRAVPDMVSDLMQALSALRATNGVGDKVGITGFCFGGGMVWNTLVAGAKVEAAVPFYGPKPADITNLANTKAAVFAIYAELDTAHHGHEDGHGGRPRAGEQEAGRPAVPDHGLPRRGARVPQRHGRAIQRGAGGGRLGRDRRVDA